MLLPSNKVQLSRAIQRYPRAIQSPYYSCYKANHGAPTLCGNGQIIAADLSSHKVHKARPIWVSQGSQLVCKPLLGPWLQYFCNRDIQGDSIEQCRRDLFRFSGNIVPSADKFLRILSTFGFEETWGFLTTLIIACSQGSVKFGLPNRFAVVIVNGALIKEQRHFILVLFRSPRR